MGRLSSRVAKFAVWFGAFTLIFLLVFSYRYLDDLARGHSGTFAVRLIEELTGSYTWGLLFLLVLKFSRRFRINARNWPRRLPAYLSAAVVFSLLHTTMLAFSRKAVFRLAGMGEYDYGIMPIRYLMEMANYLLFYTIGVTLIHLYDHYRESRERELRTAQLEAQLAQAELQSLQAQIHPHFLFNALNTISSVVYEDPRAADTMIARLSDFLRHSVTASRRQEVTLREELNFLNLYLDIMRPRFEDRLSVEIEIKPGMKTVRCALKSGTTGRGLPQASATSPEMGWGWQTRRGGSRGYMAAIMNSQRVTGRAAERWSASNCHTTRMAGGSKRECLRFAL